MCDKIDGLSLDVEKVNQGKLKAVFPECFAEGKLDIDKLLNLCGEYIDEDFEKYSFTWKGKAECYRHIGARSTGTLRPCVEESVDFENTKNVYIEGDNLEVLKLLQTSYYNKVKMIYIDPPYNTGNDFVYNDDYKDPMLRYKEVTSQTTKSNPETMGRYHTNWLNMMFPRLKLASNLLRDDGVIFISIDDNEVHNLRKLCDEVFGEENFVGKYIKQSKVGGGSDSRYMVKEHEYCIVYAKSVNSLPDMFIEHEKEYLKRYKEEDKNGKFFWDTFARPGLKNPIVYDIIAPDGTVITNGWIHSKERFEKEYEEGIVRVIKKPDGNWSVQFKQYLNINGKKPRTLTMDFGGTIEGKTEVTGLFENNKIFSYPKSTKFVKELMKTCSSEDNDIILDFFSGSATTAHAVMELNKEDGGNRRYIMVQLPELCDEKTEAYKSGYKNICEIGKERIRRAGAKLLESNGQLQIGDGNELDVGFRVFKLDTSNLKIWNNSPIEGNDLSELERRMKGMLDIIKDDRTNEDVVYEIMLKLGQDLCEDIIPININGKTVYGIGQNCLFMVCLAQHINAEDTQEMAEYAPGRIVFTDQCFDNNTDKSNVKLTLRDREITMKML